MWTSGPPCVPGNTAFVDRRAVFFFRENEAAAWSAQSLMRGGCHYIGVLARVRMQPRGDQSRNMGHVHQQQCAYRIRDCPEAGEIQLARRAAPSPGDNDFRLVLNGELRHPIEVDLLGFFVHLIRGDVVGVFRSEKFSL